MKVRAWLDICSNNRKQGKVTGHLSFLIMRHNHMIITLTVIVYYFKMTKQFPKYITGV